MIHPVDSDAWGGRSRGRVGGFLSGLFLGFVVTAGAFIAVNHLAALILERVGTYLETHPGLWKLPGVLIYGLPGLVSVTVIVVVVFRGRSLPGLGAAVGGTIGYCSVWAFQAAENDVTGLWLVSFTVLVPGLTVGLILVWAAARWIHRMRPGGPGEDPARRFTAAGSCPGQS